MATIINARSPFIITIDEALTVNNTSIELRFKNNSFVGYPSNPDYVLSKKIPAVNLKETKYNISPYIREFINNDKPWQLNGSYDTGGTTLKVPYPEDDYIILQYNTFYDSTLDDTVSNIFCTNGWGYYEDGINPEFEIGGTGDKGNVLLSEGTYYYWSDCVNPNTKYVTDAYYRFPLIPIKTGLNWKVKATNIDLNTNATTNLDDYYFDLVLVQLGIDYRYKYKVEVLDATNNVLWTSYFYPQKENKYDVICCDFVNKYGAWQRTWFYKASKERFDVTQEEYKGLDGTFNQYNTNGKESISVNTGWVDEEYNEIVLKQLVFSENILLNGAKVKLKSKSIELKKHINDRTINYSMDFDYSFDMLNTISL
jgi:hypothetical protein